MPEKIWFGNQNRFQWMPAPSTGMEAANVGYVEEMDYQQGRVGITRSSQTHKEFNFEFSTREASGYDGLDAYNKFASGFYGGQDVYPMFFADPMNYDQNLFPPGWAAPGLYRWGWSSVCADYARTYINIVTNPSVEVDATGYSVTAGTGGVASGARTGSGPQVAGAWSYRATWTTGTSAVSGGVNYRGTAVIPGALYNYSIYATSSKTQRLRMSVRHRNSGGAIIGFSRDSAEVVVAANTPTRFTIDDVLIPATTVTTDIEVYAITGTSSSNWAASNWLQVDAAMIAFVNSTNPAGYFDGTSTGASWAGVAHGSASYLYAARAVPTLSSTPANAYGLPRDQVTFDVIAPANAYPSVDTTMPEIPYALIPIPPGYTLWMGATGSATGTARVAVHLFNAPADEAAPAATAALTLLSSTGATRMNASWSGSSYQFAKVFIQRTSSTASTITLSSMMAQLWPTGVSPNVSGGFIEGKGHRGLKFADNAVSENYHIVDRNRNTPVHYKGLSTRLVEAQDRG